MKIIFADRVIAKLKYHIGFNKTNSGYLRTETIGKYVIVTDVISTGVMRIFDTFSLKEIYKLWGSDFGGVFLNEISDEIPVFLFEKLIIHMEKSKYTVFTFDSDSKSLKKLVEGSI